MLYRIMYFNSHFLETLKDNVSKEELGEFGEIVATLYANYEGTIESGYVLKKEQTKFYAFLMSANVK